MLEGVLWSPANMEGTAAALQGVKHEAVARPSDLTLDTHPREAYVHNNAQFRHTL